MSSDGLFWHNSSANNANVTRFSTLGLWEVLHVIYYSKYAEPSIDEVCQISLCWYFLLKSYAKTAHKRTRSGESTQI